MAAHRPMAAPNARAARISGTVFAVAGAAAVLCGVASTLIGVPSAARDLAPLTGPADVLNRFGQMATLLSAGISAVVAIGVAVLMATKRLAPQVAALELFVLGLAIAVCIGGAAGRIGHSTDGGVLTAAVVCVMGGAAVVAGGIVAALGRE
jgi:hypothetical protein